MCQFLFISRGLQLLYDILVTEICVENSNYFGCFYRALILLPLPIKKNILLILDVAIKGKRV